MTNITFMPNTDIFSVQADVIVNPVNRVGVMGGGLAKAFKVRYPSMYAAYRAFCEEKMNAHEDWFLHMWRAPLASDKEPYVANLPTKDHWKDDSDLALIRSGMTALVSWATRHAQRNGPLTIAVPQLGAGLGRLPWSSARKEILDVIESYSPPNISWVILGPES